MIAATLPIGAPWLCRAHGVAGVGSEATCCGEATPMRGGERQVWFALRLAAKPVAVRAAIRYGSGDPRWSMSVLAEHAYQTGKTWWWGRSVTRPPPMPG